MIDGYSRKCLCLKVNDHQRAATWLQYFKQAMAVHGRIPKRVRGDYGTENYEVAREINMINQKENAFIFGRSVHNQRYVCAICICNVGFTISKKNTYITNSYPNVMSNPIPLYISTLSLLLLYTITWFYCILTDPIPPISLCLSLIPTLHRIERMWRDSNVGVSFKFHDLFKIMEYEYG